MNNAVLAAIALALMGIVFLAKASTDQIRLDPNDAQLVSLGKTVYIQNCASCHGVNLEGQKGWQDAKVNGMRLAPPHDKSGHTWHHPDIMLFQITKYGLEAIIGRKYPNNMPVYDGVLSDEEILASLSYIKSTWPEDIKAVHDNINTQYELNKN